MTTKKAKFKCPECSAEFDTARGLGSHRLIRHGVPGSGHSAILRRKQLGQVETLPPAVPVSAAAKLQFACPECDKSFDRASSLGNHRRGIHGVEGTSHNAKKSAAQRQALATIPTPATIAANPLQCPDCIFVGKTKNGLQVHRSIRHGSVSNQKDAVRLREIRTEKRRLKIEQPTQALAIAETNGNLGKVEHVEEAHPAPSSYAIPDATLALALGRFQGFCQAFSAEFDLPPRHFASRLTELIYHSQVREIPRTRVRVPSL